MLYWLSSNRSCLCYGNRSVNFMFKLICRRNRNIHENEHFPVFYVFLGITSIGGMFCGFLSNHIDIAPNYAGTLMAITNTAATLPGIIMPIFVGAVTHGNVSALFVLLLFSSTINGIVCSRFRFSYFQRLINSTNDIYFVYHSMSSKRLVRGESSSS